MEALALAQQAEAQNATALLVAAVNNRLIEATDIDRLEPEHIIEIGILETPQQVADYVFVVLHETPVQLAARREQAQAALRQAQQAARDEVQARTNAAAVEIDNRANIARGTQNQIIGGKRRRRRTRKARKHF